FVGYSDALNESKLSVPAALYVAGRCRLCMRRRRRETGLQLASMKISGDPVSNRIERRRDSRGILGGESGFAHISSRIGRRARKSTLAASRFLDLDKQSCRLERLSYCKAGFLWNCPQPGTFAQRIK